MLAKIAPDALLTNHGIDVQAINYLAVAHGEKLRFVVTARHTTEQMDHLVSTINQVFTQLNIKRIQDWKAEGGRAGVGMAESSTDLVQTYQSVGKIPGIESHDPRGLHVLRGSGDGLPFASRQFDSG